MNYVRPTVSLIETDIHPSGIYGNGAVISGWIHTTYGGDAVHVTCHIVAGEIKALKYMAKSHWDTPTEGHSAQVREQCLTLFAGLAGKEWCRVAKEFVPIDQVQEPGRYSILHVVSSVHLATT